MKVDWKRVALLIIVTLVLVGLIFSYTACARGGARKAGGGGKSIGAGSGIKAGVAKPGVGTGISKPGNIGDINRAGNIGDINRAGNIGDINRPVNIGDINRPVNIGDIDRPGWHGGGVQWDRRPDVDVNVIGRGYGGYFPGYGYGYGYGGYPNYNVYNVYDTYDSYPYGQPFDPYMYGGDSNACYQACMASGQYSPQQCQQMCYGQYY